MIHGVTLNYSTGHVTERGGSASPETALSEKLLFRKKTVIVAVSIAFGFLKDTTFLL